MKKKRKKKSSRKGQLVCQHLEKISRKMLEQYQSIIREYVRGRHGVYALYRGNRLYYVGLASNLINRLKTHLKNWQADKWDKFSVYLTQHDKHMRELETLAIRIASPQGNRTKGGFVQSENLLKQCRRDLQASQREEIDEMIPQHQIKSSRKKQTVSQKRSRAKESGRQAALRSWQLRRANPGDYIDEKLKLRLYYKGDIFHGTLNKDGTIKCSKGVFKTLSGAAKAALGKKDNSMNGWYWWRYERTPGEWVPIRELLKTKKTKSPAAKKAASGTDKVPELAKYIKGSMKIRMFYKGKTYRATVKKDGRIWSSKGWFKSPSGAGKAITGKSCGGWYWWRYEKSPGEWAPIRELRKK